MNARQGFGNVRGQGAQPRATATDRVYKGIYQAVLEHRLEPGTWLREEELATEFGVSRTVVRQALQRALPSTQTQCGSGLPPKRASCANLSVEAAALHDLGQGDNFSPASGPPWISPPMPRVSGHSTAICFITCTPA